MKNRLLKQYLLGNVTSSERQEIEIGLISEESGDRLLERLEILESEMVEDYLDGMLTKADPARFETFYLPHPKGRRLVRFIKLLRHSARNKVQKLLPINSYPSIFTTNEFFR